MVHSLSCAKITLFSFFPRLLRFIITEITGSWYSTQMETRARMRKNTFLFTWQCQEKIHSRLVGKFTRFSGCFCLISMRTTTLFFRVNISSNLYFSHSLFGGYKFLIFALGPYIDAEGKERRFHDMKLEWGFDQFLPLEAFNDASNGYLVDETCVFGAEVFVCKERSTGKGECLSMIQDASMYKHFWKVENISKSDQECIVSKPFIVGDQKWYLP